MMTNDLENFYREHLEENIIFCLSKRKGISFEEAMRLYYNSKLAQMIYNGVEGIQYLDFKVLTDYLEAEFRQ
jgi:hypothetical protein